MLTQAIKQGPFTLAWRSLCTLQVWSTKTINKGVVPDKDPPDKSQADNKADGQLWHRLFYMLPLIISIIKLNGNAYGKEILFWHRRTLFPTRVLAKGSHIVYIHISLDFRINVRYKWYAGTVAGSLWRTTFHPQKKQNNENVLFLPVGGCYWCQDILAGRNSVLILRVKENLFCCNSRARFQGGHLRWTHRAFALSYQGTGKIDLQGLPIWSLTFTLFVCKSPDHSGNINRLFSIKNIYVHSCMHMNAHVKYTCLSSFYPFYCITKRVS